MDPHNYARKLDQAAENVRQAKDISENNKQLILRFKDECLLRISVARTYRYLQTIAKVSRWLGKDLDQADKADIKQLMATINCQPYTEWTKQMYRVLLRKFYQWLEGLDWDSMKYPDKVEWLSTSIKSNVKKLPEELLTEDEVGRMLDFSSGARDRALIAFLYESGCRFGELMNLRLKHVEFDAYGAKLLLQGKTGARKIRVVYSAPYLLEWVNKHPAKQDNEAPLWVKRDGTQPQYAGVSRILRDTAKRAGISKHIYPHLFRHSRATGLANHLTDAQMKEYFGWTQGSKMASVYIHLSGRDTENAILKMHGMQVENNHEAVLSLRTCGRCKESNPPTNKFCGRCSMPLDKQEAVKILQNELDKKQANDILDGLLEDAEFKEFFQRKVRERLAVGR